MSVDTVKRELLVRHLEAWAPAALHRARRVVYLHGYADEGATAEAALRVLTDQADLVRGRELSMVAVGDDLSEVTGRLDAVRREAGEVPGLAVHAISGGTDQRVAVALQAT